MKHTLNILPVEFGTGGLMAQKIGPESDPGVAQQLQQGAFAHHGWVMRWPSTTQGSAALPVPPWEVPEASTPRLLQLLHQILASHHQASLQTDHIRLRPPGHAHAIRLHIHHDPSRRMSAVVVQAENPHALPQAIAFANDHLMGKHLPEKDLRIGNAFETTRGSITEAPLVFSIDGTQSNADAFLGLRTHGPYDRRRITAIHLLVLSQAGTDGSASRLTQELKTGINHIQNAAANWAGGMEKVFHLKVHSRTGNEDPAEWIAQARQIRAEFAQAVVLHVGHEEDDKLRAGLLAHGIAMEHLPAKLTNEPETARAQALARAALHIYAKAGGSPWLLHHQPTTDHELLIGLGTTTLGQQHYGYATVFSSQGHYRLGQASIIHAGTSFAQAMANELRIMLQELRHQSGWQDGQAHRIIFHLAQPLDEDQRKAIRAHVVDALGDKLHLKFHFLHLHHDHPYRWWRSNAPINGPAGDLGLSRSPTYAPGTAMRILQLDPKQLPLAVSDLDNHTSTDMDHLAQQIHYFSKMSWDSTDPAQLPVTLLYGHVIAKLTERWRQKGISLPHPIPDSLSKLPWYL